MLSETELETLRLAYANGGTLQSPGIGPLWRICSRLCELDLLEAWGSQLTLTQAGRDVVIGGRRELRNEADRPR